MNICYMSNSTLIITYNTDPQKLYYMDTININILFVRKLWLKGLKDIRSSTQSY